MHHSTPGVRVIKKREGVYDLFEVGGALETPPLGVYRGTSLIRNSPPPLGPPGYATFSRWVVLWRRPPSARGHDAFP